MVKEIYICDCCKEETENLYKIKIDMKITSYFVRKYDLCNKCRNKILNICEGKEIKKYE